MEKWVPLEIFAIYFSGFSAHAIEFDGVIYPTLEHAYHCLRYTDPTAIKDILAARSPEMSWNISQQYKSLRLSDFKHDAAKLDLMEKLVRLKYEQHADVRRALQESGDLLIVKKITTGPPGDGFWDIGDGNGLNNVGKIWMRLRAEARP